MEATTAGKRSNRVLLGLGVSLALLMGSGVFALVSDSITSSGNSAQSGTFSPPPPPSQDVQVASTDDFGASCSDLTYGNSLPTTFTLADLDLATTQNVYSTRIFCIKNAGSTAGKLSGAAVNYSATEVGCSTGEFDAGDTNCGGGPGELGAVIDEFFSNFGETGSDPDCLSLESQGIGFTGANGHVLNGSLPPGGYCKFVYMLTPKFGSTDTQRVLAQTDRIQWDLVFTLEDVPA